MTSTEILNILPCQAAPVTWYEWGNSPASRSSTITWIRHITVLLVTSISRKTWIFPDIYYTTPSTMFHHNDPVYYGLQTCFFDLSWQSSVRNSAALKGTLIWKLGGVAITIKWWQWQQPYPQPCSYDIKFHLVVHTHYLSWNLQA